MADKRKGYVKAYRSVWDNPMFTKERFNKYAAWMYLISHAAHKDQTIYVRNERLDIKRGQVFTSVRKLSEIFHWSTNTVLHFLCNTRSLGMTDSYATHNGTLITILNYNKFQGSSADDPEDCNASCNTDCNTDCNANCNTDCNHIIIIKNDIKNSKRMNEEASGGCRGREVFEE